MANSGTAVEMPSEPRMAPSNPWTRTQWGKPLSPTDQAPVVSLMDVMSEQLASTLHQQDTQIDLLYETPDVADFPGNVDDITLDGVDVTDGVDTRSDYELAMALQRQFDREHDTMLEKEEAKYNGQSKVSLSFANYRSTNTYQDDDSDNESESEDEECWVDKEKDTVVKFDKRGLSGKGKNITTKHDANLCGMKNASRVMNFPPAFETGDVYGEDLRLNNRVYNRLKCHSMDEEKRRVRLHEKKENATTEQAVDPKTRLIMYKLINANILESLSGVVSTGKESVIFHAYGGGNKDVPVPIPAEVAIKVFKTTKNEFHTRSQYVKGDYRFSKDDFKKKNPRKIIRIWTEKELINLRKLRRVGIRCPEPIMLRKHLLVMSFVGENQIPAKKLKDCTLTSTQWVLACNHTFNAMKVMYRDAKLVHADLSEYNLLHHEGNIWVIDVSQSVDLAHPNALEFLLRDCKNVTQFFREKGVLDVPSEYELFNDITGLEFQGEDKEFLSQVQDYEDSEIWMANDSQRTNYQFDYFFNKEVSKRSPQSKSSSKHKTQTVTNN